MALLHSLQFGKVSATEKKNIRIRLKKAAMECMRAGEAQPLPLGWYVALMLEQPDNAFIKVTDRTLMPTGTTKATFAVAWSYDYLEELDSKDRSKRFEGMEDTEEILAYYYNIDEIKTIKEARNKYGPYVKAINRGAFEAAQVKRQAFAPWPPQ
jgi:hypothetical protein